MTEHRGKNALTWRIVAARDDSGWPCTIVDDTGRSLLGIHDGTPVVRDRPLAERLVASLNLDADKAQILDVIEREYELFRRHHADSQTRQTPEGFARLFREWIEPHIRSGATEEADRG